MENKQYSVLKAQLVIEQSSPEFIKKLHAELEQPERSRHRSRHPASGLAFIMHKHREQKRDIKIIQRRIEDLRNLPRTYDHCRFSQHYHSNIHKKHSLISRYMYVNYVIFIQEVWNVDISPNELPCLLYLQWK